MQETGDMFAASGILPEADGGECQQNFNILMGDGSVKNFIDGSNGDGYLNPGFRIGVATALTDASGVGYSDSEVEHPTQPGLRAELLAMEDADQAMREDLSPVRLEATLVDADLVDQRGFPCPSRSGHPDDRCRKGPRGARRRSGSRA